MTFEVYRPHPEDTHRRAVEYANEHTRFYFGEDSVPCELGSEAHKYWLSCYDGVVEKFEQAY